MNHALKSDTIFSTTTWHNMLTLYILRHTDGTYVSVVHQDGSVFSQSMMLAPYTKHGYTVAGKFRCKAPDYTTTFRWLIDEDANK